MAIANILDNIISGLEWDVELIIQGEPASKANSRRLVRKRVGSQIRIISIKSEKFTFLQILKCFAFLAGSRWIDYQRFYDI